jgi:hypothetical protein
MNAGIWHAENAALCTVARDVTEVTWSLLTVTRPSSYRVTQQHGAKRGEGREGKTRQRSATVAQSLSLRLLNFSSSRMGRLSHNINQLVFIMKAQHIFYEVRTEFLTIIYISLCFRILKMRNTVLHYLVSELPPNITVIYVGRKR